MKIKLSDFIDALSNKYFNGQRLQVTASYESIDMPSDILLTIPLYIASVCLQIDNIQKAQLLRQEFEIALARCTSGDFMTLNAFESLL